MPKATVWSWFSSSDMDFSGRALFHFKSRFSLVESLLFGDLHREINSARPLCLWTGTSAYINIHMRLFQTLSLGTGAVDEPRRV